MQAIVKLVFFTLNTLLDDHSVPRTLLNRLPQLD